MSFNEKLSYTEYIVTTPTTDFAFGFEFLEGVDAVRVLVNDVDALEAGYAIRLKNSVTMEVQPAVESGIVRIYRETNIDTSLYQFTAGAKFVAANIDANFEQLLHSQQEVRDQFIKLRTDTFITLKDFQEENLQELKEYVDGVFGMTNPNIFDGISDNMVVTREGDTQREVNGAVNGRLLALEQDVGILETDKIDRTEFELELSSKADNTTVGGLADQLITKASTQYVDDKVGAVSNGLVGSYLTYAALDGAKGTLPVNSSAKVTNDPDPSKNGEYTWNGTVLTLSDYDPASIAAKYTDAAISTLPVAWDTVAGDAVTVTDDMNWLHSSLKLDGTVDTPLFQLNGDGGGFQVVDEDGWVLSGYSVAPPEPTTPVWAGKKYLLFGDSITQTGDPDNGNYGIGFRPNWWVYSREHLKAGDFYNFARSGASYREYGQLPWQKISHQVNFAASTGFVPDVVIISCGTNDGITRLGDYDEAVNKPFADLDMFVTADAMRWAYQTINDNYPNARLFSMLPIQRHDVDITPRAPLYELIEKMATRYGFKLINTLGESGIVREFETAGAGRDLYDGLHPNPKGQLKMAKVVSPVVRNVLTIGE